MTGPEVLVIGAGPAGAMAARECARLGATVLLVDKAVFPRPKICGSCINPDAIATLRAAGLTKILASAVPLAIVTLNAAGRHADLPLRGVALTREAFDAGLVDAAIAAGVRFLPGTRAAIGPTGPDGREVRLGGATVTARVVIDAGGLSSGGPPRPDSRIGAGAILDGSGIRPGVLTMAVAPAGYVGVVGVEDGRVAVAAALDARAVRDAGGPGPLAARIVGRSEIPGLETASFKGTPALSRRAPHLAETRLFRIGDAAAFVEPFTGQGIAWALAGGMAVAPLALEGARRWNGRLVHRWTRLWATTVRRRQRECAVISRLVRSPRLTTSIVGLLARAPGLAAPVLRSINRRGVA